ncbi:hypothetical protein GH714_031806 [Hevea brasiliensis]|uniref:Protein kinase domain-containing protein n=1 Tax=Hevea brasiliensis TaxID=3981 RepID=A0A6A6NKP6_HEVBR|nr:hypothetical protein GH714_031806 [Hevea brasiliensis]
MRLLFFFLPLLPLANSVYFNVDRFGPETTNVLYRGDAMQSVGVVELNSKYTYTCRVGWAVYAERVLLWDSNTGKLSDFTSHFSIIINTQGLAQYGHGLAFFLGPSGFEIPPNSAGGFLGLFNTSTMDSSNQIVMVEFDSYPNEEWDPKPLVEHVGINNSSLASAVYTPWNASFHSGDTADVRVTYNATTKNFSVFWTYLETSSPQENTSLFYIIDLMEVLPEWVTIGFSASTGGTIVGILIAWRRRRRKQTMARKDGEKRNSTAINEDLERRVGPRRFSYEDLVSATNNFSKERMLGKGGFGAVYKGYLIDMDLAIAVKKISRGLDRVKRSILPSLDDHLFGSKSTLTWAVRYKISLGLASALLYLHEEWEQCVVHRDVKSSNVMLDSNFNAKLGDFGLARLTDHELGPQTTGLAGTVGYLAPEYIRTRRASKESDVYSFGVVALEIASGKRAIDQIEQEHEMNLVEWIWELYGRGKLHLAADKKLRTDYEEQQVECLMIVGLWCAHPDHNLRPSIRQAIHVLNFEAAIPNLPAKMPMPIFRVPSPSVSSGEPFLTNSSLGLGR